MILSHDVLKELTINVLNVPALVCEQCGEEFVPLETARKGEQLVHKGEKDGLQMGFLNYPQAA